MKFTERFPALASRDFLIFWAGHFLSLVGSWMQATTLPYLAYRLSGRPLDLGIIGFSATLPTLLLALPGGVLVERMDKRKTVIVLQFVMMLQAFTLAFLALTGLLQIWQIILLSFVLGAASAIEITARQAMLVELVGKPALPNAIALQATSFNLARVLGPSLSAVVLLLVKTQGEGWAFFINGVSFIFIIIGLFFVCTPFRTLPQPSNGHRPKMTTEFREGWNYIRSKAVISFIIMMAALIGFFGFPFIQQIPALARDVLHQVVDTEVIIKTRTSALYLAQGVGALIAALSITIFSQLKRKSLLMVIGQFTFSLMLVLLALIHSISLALVLVGILGCSMVTQLMMMNTLIQLDVPDNLRGRVFSIYLWALQGVAPFGSLFIGWLAQTIGVSRTALVCGGVCLLTILIIQIKWPILRRNFV